MGSNVTRVRVNDRVIMQDANLARTAVVLDEHHVVRCPDTWSLESSAALPVVALTSSLALIDACPVHDARTVLIVGGGSATGKMGIQVAREYAAHANIIVYCGNCSHDAMARGANAVIDRNNETLRAGLARLNITELDVVYECVRGSEHDVYAIASSLGNPCIVTIDPGHNMLALAPQLIWRTVLSWLRLGPRYIFLMRPLYGGLDRLVSLMTGVPLQKLEHTVFPLTTEGVRDAFAHVGKGKALLKVAGRK